MTTLLEQAVTEAKQLSEAEQDAAAKGFLQVLADIQKNHETVRSGPRPKFGSAKGKVFLADDFDAPLEDFKDYM